MAGPAAVIAAWGLLPARSPVAAVGRRAGGPPGVPRGDPGGVGRRPAAGGGVRRPAAGAQAVDAPHPEGVPWYSPTFATIVALVAAAFAVGSLALYRRAWAGFVAGTVLLALLSHVVFVWGYRSGEGNVGDGPAPRRPSLDLPRRRRLQRPAQGPQGPPAAPPDLPEPGRPRVARPQRAGPRRPAAGLGLPAGRRPGPLACRVRPRRVRFARRLPAQLRHLPRVRPAAGVIN